MRFISLKNKLYLATFITLALTLSLYVFLRLKMNFLSLSTSGDEDGFLLSFNYFVLNGWEKSNIHGHSILFNVFAYPFYLITDNQLLSLRLVSLFSNLITISIVYKIAKGIFKLKGFLLYGLILTVLNILIVSSFMFTAYNDSLLLPFLFIFIYHYLKIIKYSSSIYNFAVYSGIALFAFVSIRQLTIIYTPFFIILLIDVYRKQKVIFSPLVLFLASFIIPLFLLNFPSISSNGKLSYHSKGNPAKDVTWSQLQYLSALKKDKGVITKDYHVSLNEVRDYLRINGEKSLPQNIGETLLFDLKITIKEFFKDFLGLIKPCVRLMGFLFLGLLFLKRKVIKYNSLLVFSVGFLAAISLIIISYVESRWVIGVFVILTMYLYANFKSVKDDNKLYLFLSLNMLILAIFNFPFLLKNILPLIY